MTDVPELPPMSTLVLDDEPFTDDELDAYLTALADAPVEIEADGTVVEHDAAVVWGEAVVEPMQRVEAWVVTDRPSAEWAARKYVEAQAQIVAIAVDAEELRARLDEERRRIDEWEAAAAKGPTRSRGYFEAVLTRYMREKREASAFPNKKTGEIDYKVKSIPLPSVRLKSRSVQPTVKLPEEAETKAELVAIIEQLAPASITKSVTVSAVKALPYQIDDDGHVVLEVPDQDHETGRKVVLPGVVRVEARVSYDVEPL